MPLQSPQLAEVAAQAEIAECHAWADQLAAASTHESLRYRVASWRLAGHAFALSVPTMPLTLFNRVIGLLPGRLPDSAEIALIEQFFNSALTGRWALQPAPGAAEAVLEPLLRSRGYAPLAQQIVKVARDLRSQPQASPTAANGLSCVRVGPGETPLFVEPIVAGMGLPGWFRDWLSLLPGRPGWHTYAALSQGVAVAAAAMFISRKVAWLGMATTVPAQRRLGAQRLLMLQRLADATEAGCSLAFTETGLPQAGEPHPSYSNMLGCGMQPVSTRLSWARSA